MTNCTESKISIAVVIPAYNAALTISRAIDSAINQSRTADEIIVVDDGSTDGTEDIIKRKFQGIRYVSQENQGSSVARQVGSDLANCEYIAYLDADDFWPRDKLEDLQNILQNECVDFLLADLNREKGSRGKTAYLPKNTSFFPWADRYWNRNSRVAAIDSLYKLQQDAALSLLLSGFPVFPSTMLVSKRAIRSCGGWDSRFRRCQDFDFGLRLARHYPLYFFSKVHATLGIHEGNFNAISYFVKQSKGDIEVLKIHAKELNESSQLTRRTLVALSNKYCRLGYVFRNNGDLILSSQYYWEAMKLPGKRTHAALRFAALKLASFFG